MHLTLDSERSSVIYMSDNTNYGIPDFTLHTFSIGEWNVEDFRFEFESICALDLEDVGRNGAVHCDDEGLVTIVDRPSYDRLYVRNVQDWYIARAYGEEA